MTTTTTEEETMRRECAMAQTADGVQVRRPEAEQNLEKFRRALTGRGGSMRPGERWNAARGFHVPGGLTLADAIARQHQVAREIQWQQLRGGLPPALAVLAVKLDRAMR